VGLVMDEKTIQCPYCWELITVLVDTSVSEQDYIEDCSVCCHPIHFRIKVDEGETVEIEALHEDAF